MIYGFVSQVIQAKDCFQNGGHHKDFEEVSFSTNNNQEVVHIRVKQSKVEMSFPYHTFLNMPHETISIMIGSALVEINSEYYNNDWYRREAK